MRTQKLSKSSPPRRSRQHAQSASKPNGSSPSIPSAPAPNGSAPCLPGASAFAAVGQNGAATALTRDDILQSLNHEITSAAPRIVHKILEHAEEHASYLHAKFLFDFAGLHAAPAPANNSAEHSLAALLLRALDIPAPLSPAATEQPSAPAHPTELHD